MGVGVQLLLVVENAVLYEQVVAAHGLAHACDVIGPVERRLFDDVGIPFAEAQHLVAVERPVGRKRIGKISEASPRG